MNEHLQPMALRQFDEFGNGFRDEGHSLVRAALLASISDTFRGGEARRLPEALGFRPPPVLLKKLTSNRIQYCPEITPLQAQL